MSSRKRITKTILIILIAGIVIQILFDPLTFFLGFGEMLEARLRLPAARRKWEAHEITHYRFDIQGVVPLVCLFGGNIEVKDGMVIHSDQRSDGQLAPGLRAIKDPSICNYETYTMPQLFNELERWQREAPFSISEVSFDTDYGFISSFHYGSSGGRGLLSPRISDCCGGFTVENFQVLDE